MLQLFVSTLFFSGLLMCTGTVYRREDGLYGPRYRPLWKKGAQTKYTTVFGPSSIRRLIENAGFGYENYTVTTEDGYLINLNRMVHPDKAELKDKGFPVFAINGFFMQSDAWMLQSMMDSNVVAVWSALGYDVWLGDQRGTIRSKGHVKYDANRDKEYWDHATEEIGVYDVAAFIDFILKKTGYKQLVLMCVSMGCSYHAVLISSRPEYNEKILGAFYFNPLVNNIRRQLDMPFIYLQNFFVGEFFVASYEHAGKLSFVPHLPAMKKESFYLCQPFVNLIVPISSILYNGTMHLPKTFCYQSSLSSGGGSVKSAKHILQVYKSGEFAKYDYGREGNMKHYGQDIPPLYDMNKITSFVAVYYSDADGYTTVEGMKKTFLSLGGPTYDCLMPALSHFDVSLGVTFKYIFPDVNEVLDSLTGYSDDRGKFMSGKCPSMEWTRNLKS